EPLKPRYQVGDRLVHKVCENVVTGPHAGEKLSLVCHYAGRPVVMIFTRAINAPVTRLIKKLDEATGEHEGRAVIRDRLGSYVVLLSPTEDREGELKTLAEKEHVGHATLALLVINESTLQDGQGTAGVRWLQRQLGTEAEVTVVVAKRLRVRAS